LLQRFDLDPFGPGYFHGPWQTGPGDNHFGIHFSRNVKMREVSGGDQAIQFWQG
jgi:hypothetical protein